MTSLSGKRIGLLAASVSRLNGGVFEAVVTQAEMIRRAGGEAVVFGLADPHSKEDAARFAPSRVVHAKVIGPSVVGYSQKLLPQLLAEDVDLLHLHGIWMYPSRAGTLWARATGRPYVISPHGMLDPWITGRGRLKKELARVGYERASWRSASMLHALTDREAADIARESGRLDSVVIPNAGPPALPTSATLRPPHFVYLGRIHPKKNIAALVTAWTDNAGELAAAGARLTIAGWGEDAHVASLRAQLDHAPSSVRFVGPVYGKEKGNLLADARFVVLASHSEGLPMVILEGWSAGTPSIMSAECNLPEGFTHGAAIECGYDAVALGRVLLRAAKMPAGEWIDMAEAAHALATGPFGVDAIETRWTTCYADLIAKAKAGHIV